MFKPLQQKYNRGISLIEVLVVIAITVLVFGGLFASFEFTLKVIAQSRAQMTALSLATDRLEYIQSLPYNDVGTISGIPEGLIPQNRTVSLNGIEFNERVYIQYEDDDADGFGPADSNLILADYKTVKVEYSWNIYGGAKSFSLITTIVPRSIETTAGGGTIRVNVFDANVLPLAGIDVRLLNETTTSTIDITRKTDATGIAYFTGAPAASEYELFVSAPGYSSDQTRRATTSLENPSKLPVTVLESDITTMNFQIDLLGDLTVNIFNNPVIQNISEEFTDLLNAAATSSVEVAGGDLVLNQVAGVYDISGAVVLNPLTPSTIESWGVAEVTSSKPSGTDFRVRFYTSTNTADIISDTYLPGNSVGFSDRFIDLRGLDAGTFSTIVAGIELTTSNTTVTPRIDELVISYIESKNMLSGVNFNLRGNKSIGTNSALTTVYKFDVSSSTDGSGQRVFNDIEWDSYLVSLTGGSVIMEACASNPITVNPGSEVTLDVRTTTSSTNNLRVVVNDSGLESSIIDATVTLTRPAYSSTINTGWCGQSYFGGLLDAADYRLEVSAPGYATQVLDPYVIGGSSVQVINLAP